MNRRTTVDRVQGVVGLFPLLVLFLNGTEMDSKQRIVATLPLLFNLLLGFCYTQKGKFGGLFLESMIYALGVALISLFATDIVEYPLWYSLALAAAVGLFSFLLNFYDWFGKGLARLGSLK
jgi:hypothetical protein